jgi:hypothetical protein
MESVTELQFIHLVSLDVPYPPNYGAMIDIYHRCKSLTDVGAKVILHCFDYGRGRPKELESVACKVHYYSRSKNPLHILSPLPFIVRSRMNAKLLSCLLKDNYPILFEGIHTCGFVGNPKLKNRWIGVRAHNIEHDYYNGLAAVEPNFFKRWFYRIEAKKLEKYENWCYRQVNEILAVSYADTSYFLKKYSRGVYLPVFNPLNWGEGSRGRGNHVLLHGNLSVIENIKGIEFVLDQVWQNDFGVELVIAGKDPSKHFQEYVQNHPCKPRLIINPDDNTLNQLIRTARINLIPTFQATGLKHKLLNALANGGFCLATPQMVHGTALDALCVIGKDAQEWKKIIPELLEREITEDDIENRLTKLRSIFDNQTNAKRILELISN